VSVLTPNAPLHDLFYDDRSRWNAAAPHWHHYQLSRRDPFRRLAVPRMLDALFYGLRGVRGQPDLDKRFDKRQSMRWTPRGAHLLLQTRTRVLNGDLDQLIRRRYPAFRKSAGNDLAPVL
jgi:hypothetical protein